MRNAPGAGVCWRPGLELATNLREDFTIIEKAPTRPPDDSAYISHLSHEANAIEGAFSGI